MERYDVAIKFSSYYNIQVLADSPEEAMTKSEEIWDDVIFPKEMDNMEVLSVDIERS